MKSVLTIAAVGALALSLAACGSSGNTTGNPGPSASGGQNFVNGKTFTMVIGSDPGNLDPQLTTLSVANQVDKFLYDSLVNFEPNGSMTAGLASKWQGTSTKATFTLRKGVTCSDGSPLTATDIAKNITFVGNPKSGSALTGIEVPVGAKATGDDSAGTVSVTAPKPDAFLVRDVGGLPIVCAKGMADRSSLKQGADGTGPYTLTQVVASDHYVLTKRDGYAWGPGKWDPKQPGLPAKVVLKVVSNESTAANLLLSGQANLAQIVGPDRQRLAAQNLFSRDVLAPLGELWFNQKAGEPTADEAVRRALTQALDLDQLGKVLTSGSGKPATGLVAPGNGPCTGDTVSGNLPSHDVDAAKAALDAAGWTAGANGVRSKNGTKLAVTFYYTTSLGPTMESAAELIQKAWQAVGADVTIKGGTSAQLDQVIDGNGSWTASIVPLTVTLPTQLVPFLSGPVPPKGNNFAGIDNAAYTADVQKASAKPGDAGCPDWEAAEKSIVQHVDLVPFVDSVVPVFARGATFQIAQATILPTSIRMLG